MVNVVVAAVVVIFVLGLLGGLGLLAGTAASEGIVGYLAYFVGSLGELIQLVMPLIAGIAGIFVVSSLGGTLTADALKQIAATSALSHTLSGVLGAICGAVLLGLVAGVASQAAWLGLLVPVSAGAIAAPILPMIYERFAPGPKSTTRRTIRALLSWAGIAIAFVLVFLEINLRRTLVEGTLPGQTTVLSLAGINISAYMLQIMIAGAVLGGLAGTLAGMKATFPIGEILYSGTRTILNALRSIEPLIMGLVFVIWVGIGPFAGVLALTLHSIASLGKLYSEQIENIDDGPIEALTSTGANRLQTIVYAVVPQIIPPYIAFTMYRWDINVRMSTIIGFVGGGGIGFLLQQQINLLRYRDAGVAVLAIAIVVSVLDYASASFRERII
ncbi:MAG: ABC transporter permease subunit [Anaerolineae bacterium]|nr:ABC transporter permease subunit [Anaerolineae bacterium]